MTEAKVIADSVSHADGVRLTTMQVTMHRFVLAEFNTHRVFSRNSASNRAIPVHKQISRIMADLAYPVIWPVEQPGMQGGAEIDPEYIENERDIWRQASGHAIEHASSLVNEGIHKSVTNRLLEPFMWHTVVVTSTAWENFFALRLDADAQPEIRVAAEAMRAAYDASTPLSLAEGEWHLPYVSNREVEDGVLAYEAGTDPETVRQGNLWVLRKISAARCARTSYLTQEGIRDLSEDVRLYDRLVTQRLDKGLSIHWSPLEHVATPWPGNRQEGCIHFGQDEHLAGVEDTFTCFPLDHLPRVGNLLGWRSLRTTVEAETGTLTFV